MSAAPRWLAPLVDAPGGDPAQLRRDSSTLPGRIADPRESAVLVLLGGDPDADTRPADASVVLTHRSPQLRRHAGQMAFPGGKTDPGDRGPVHTALREAAEETGLDPAGVDPLRVLDRIGIRRTGFAVRPVLAYWRTPGPLRAVDPAETDEVLTVAVDELVDPANRLRVGLAGWSGPAFRVGDYVVWGFTAGVLAHLLDHAGWSRPWDDGPVQDLRRTLAASANRESLGLGGRLR